MNKVENIKTQAIIQDACVLKLNVLDGQNAFICKDLCIFGRRLFNIYFLTSLLEYNCFTMVC